jgi:hypothetical protein
MFEKGEDFLFDAFSLREPGATSLENAMGAKQKGRRKRRPFRAPL